MEETLSLLNATTRIFFKTRLLIFLQKVLYDIEYSGVTAQQILLQLFHFHPLTTPQ